MSNCVRGPWLRSAYYEEKEPRRQEDFDLFCRIALWAIGVAVIFMVGVQVGLAKGRILGYEQHRAEVAAEP